MKKIDHENAVKLAKEKFASAKDFNLNRAKGLVENAGRVVAVPPIDMPGYKTLKDYEEGAILGRLNIDYAPAGAIEGTFDVKVMRDHGTWVAQLVRDNEVVYSTTAVWAEDLHESGPQKPVVTVYAFSPFVFVFFMGGVYLGIVIGLAIR